VEYVNLAADLGAPHISLALTQLFYNPQKYREWSLKEDPALRRETVAAMRDRGVKISIVEGMIVRPDADVSDLAEDFALSVEMGATRVNTVSLDPDLGRTYDQFAKLVEMANDAGMKTSIEFAPGLTVDTLDKALAAIRHVNDPNFQLLVDTMHLIRSGSSAKDIAALDPKIIGHAQISDSLLTDRFETYMEEAMYERMPPGSGQLPLRDIVNALPRDVVLGIEVPLRSKAEVGILPHERLQSSVAGVRNILAQLDPR
jgi:sugar phosphate isomerase/epimerase